jgi:peptidyl-prolyl cis-trans isomerase A (cyclophilin A)
MLAILLASVLATSASAVAPESYEVTFETDVKASPSSIVVAVNRSLAPLGADNFFACVNDGFYNDSAFFRVVPGFVVQFGISGSKLENDKWLHKSIKDDKVMASNTVGTLVYADAGPDTRSTQLFINYGDNSRLDGMGFAPFGKVTEGMEVATKIFNPTPGGSGGVDQGEYEQEGNDWIRKTYPGVNFITGAAVTKQS